MSIDETSITVIDLGPPDEDLRTAKGSAADEPQGIIEGGMLVAIGLATLAVESDARAIGAALGEHSPSVPDTASDEEKEEAAGPDEPELMTVIAGAGLSLAFEAARFLTRTVAGIDRAVRPLSLVAMIPPVDRAARRLERSAIQMNEGWRDERLESQRVAEAFADALVPHLMDAVIDRLDLTELVLERVDLDLVVESVAIDRLIERVDLDDVVARVDVGLIIDRVDLAAIVDRLDVDAVAARIDIERIIDRLDVVAIARGVIDELDLPEIIRGSTETMAAETRDGVRVQGMRADRFVSHLVDRALMRGREERPSTSGIAGDSTEDPP